MQGGPARFVAGDPLRTVAAVAVFVYHAALFALVGAGGSDFAGAFGRVPGAVLENLNLGLFVFFVLSGYLLGRPFVAAYIGGGPYPSLAPYVRNRLVRIVPAFWAVFALVLLWYGTDGSSATQIAAVPLFAQVYHQGPVIDHLGQAWTLDVELAFYLLLPAAAALLAAATGRRGTPGRRLAVILPIASLAAVASVAARAQSDYDDAFILTLPACLFAFMPGIALAAVEPYVIGRARRILWPGLWALGLLGLAALSFAAYVAVPRTAIAERAVLAALISGALVAAPLWLEWCSARPWRLLDNRAMHWIGKRSYGLYLVHVPLITPLLEPVLGEAGARGLFVYTLAVGLPVSLLAAALIHRFVERPALALRSSARRRSVRTRTYGLAAPRPRAARASRFRAPPSSAP